MRKAVAGIALALALAPAALSAQVGTVNATARIVGTLTVLNETDLDFGSLTPGGGVTLTPGVAAPAGTVMGEIEIGHNSNFTVSASVPANLDNAGTPLPVSFQCGWSTTSGGPTSGNGACSAVAAGPATVAGTPTTSYLQVGGTILGADTGGLPLGSYTGVLTFTFTATF